MLAGLHSQAPLRGWVLCRPPGWGLSTLPGVPQPLGAIQIVLLEMRCWHLHPRGGRRSWVASQKDDNPKVQTRKGMKNRHSLNQCLFRVGNSVFLKKESVLLPSSLALCCRSCQMQPLCLGQQILSAFASMLARLFLPFCSVQNLPVAVYLNEFMMVQGKYSLLLLNV